MRRHGNRSGSSDGFTLLETLIVLAIVGLGATLSIAALKPLRERSLAINMASDIKSILLDARTAALSGGGARHVDYLPERRRLVLRETGRSVAIGDEVGLSFLTGSPADTAGQMRTSTATFLFLPDGTSSGGTVTVTATNATRNLRVSWLTGAIADAR